jgi:hypothetical protein
LQEVNMRDARELTQAPFPHTFEAPLEMHGVGKTRVIWYTVIFLPHTAATKLPLKDNPRLRVRGEINDVPFEGAWIPAGDGRHYLIVSRALRKATAIEMGARCAIRFCIDDQDRVSMPEDLSSLLKRDKVLAKVWASLTPGKQRGYAYRVESAKTEATRTKRLVELRDELVDGVPGAMSRRDANLKLRRSVKKNAAQ